MTALPLSNAFRNAVNQGVGKQAFEDLRDFVAQMTGGAPETELTIAAGAITPTGAVHFVDSEADAATDDLDTINQTNLPDGSFLWLYAANAGRFVRVRHNIGGDGKILMKDSVPFTIVGQTSWLLLRRAGVVWGEIARFAGPQRERLTANRIYYVRTDGSDSNDGLSNSASGAFLTLTKAWAVIRDTLDLNNFAVTVQIADGTYTGNISAVGSLVGATSPSAVVFQGNAGSPSNVVISATGANSIFAQEGATFTIKDLELRATTAGNCIMSRHAGTTVQFSNIVFGACANSNVACEQGGLALAIGNYSITGSAQRHLLVLHAGSRAKIDTFTVTLTGTPAFSFEFALALDLGYITALGTTFSGSATGQRYELRANGVIQTGGGGANYFPGDVAGAVATGGQYV